MQITNEVDPFELGFWIRTEQGKVAQESKEFQLLAFLYKLCSISFYEEERNDQMSIQQIRLTADELQLVKDYQLCECSNLYIRAICLDLVVKEEHDKREGVVKASAAYLELCKVESDPWYLLRAIEVRSYKFAKSASFLNDVCEQANNIHPAWLLRLTECMIRTYNVAELSDFIALLRNKLQSIGDVVHRDEERLLLHSLHKLKQYTTAEWHLQNALSYEKEVDNQHIQAKKNTIYPMIHVSALDAYREIQQVKDKYPEDFKRIQAKLLVEQKAFANSLPFCGISFKYSASPAYIQLVNDYFDKHPIKNSLSLLLWLSGIPFIDSERFNKQLKKYQEESFTAQFMGASFLDGRGRILGKSEPEEAARIHIHKQNRAHLIALILISFKRTLELAERMNERSVWEYIMNAERASYIEQSRLGLWAKGICEGLKGDMIVAAHLLVPQIEHALKVKVLQFKPTIVKLENEKRHDELSLEPILNFLKPYFKEELYNEFFFFFNHGNDENFRNNLAHGIASIDDIQRCGIYVWWLAIKLFFCEKEIFMDEY